MGCCRMEKYVEINSAGEVVLDKEIISAFAHKGERLRCIFDDSKIILIPENTAHSDGILLKSLLKKLETEHKEGIPRENLKEEFEQLVAKGKELIEKNIMEWEEPEEILREMRTEHETNLMQGLGYEK